MNKYGVLFFIILLFIYSSYDILSYPQVNHIYIKVFNDGVVLVNYVIYLSNDTIGSIDIPLIGRPETEIIVVDENNIPLPYQLNKTVLTIFYVNASKISIRYFTQTLTLKIKGIWCLNFTTNLNTTIELPSKSIIIDLSTVPLVINFSGNRPILIFPPGKYYIKYIIPIIVANNTKSTSNASKGNRSESGKNLSLNEGKKENDFTQYIMYMIIPVLTTLIIVLAILKYRKRRIASIELKEEELQVLNIIREMGGECYQYEIGRRLFLPKTTLWRIVRRLENMGYIEVIKIRGQNYIRLIKNL